MRIKKEVEYGTLDLSTCYLLCIFIAEEKV